MPAPWPLGTNAPKQLKDVLAAFVEAQRPHFPPGYVTITLGTKKGAGVRVELYSQADTRPAHQYRDDSGREVLEEYHRLAIEVKSDDKSGGAAAGEAVYETIKSAVLSTAGREVLIAQGVFDVREIPEAPEYGEVAFEHPLHLSVNTDKYLT